MSDFSTLKEEIMNWAMLPHAMKEFTTHDVYDNIHSAETSGAASDALRSLWKYDKKLNRRESVDGNRKIFFYSLRYANPEDIIISNEDKTIIPDIQASQVFHNSIPKYKYFGVTSSFDLMQGITGTEPDNKTQKQSNQQIEIPNNFVIELKTPNGFTITIKAGDLMK